MTRVPAAFENRYRRLDRWLHRLAFAVPSAQLGLADLEERWFAEALSRIELAPPLFITGLPTPDWYLSWLRADAPT